MKYDQSENTRQKVGVIASALGVQLEEYDTGATHRLGKTEEKKLAPIIVSLNNQEKKNQMISASKEKKVKRGFSQ